MLTNIYYIKPALVCLRFMVVFMIKALDLLNDLVVTLKELFHVYSCSYANAYLVLHSIYRKFQSFHAPMLHQQEMYSEFLPESFLPQHDLLSFTCQSQFIRKDKFFVFSWFKWKISHSLSLLVGFPASYRVPLNIWSKDGHGECLFILRTASAFKKWKMSAWSS